MQRLHLLSLIPYLVLSCSTRDSLTAGQLKDYIIDNDHGLIKEVIKDNVNIKAFYMPTELVWFEDLRKFGTGTDREKFKQNYDSLSYFILHFSSREKEIESLYVSDPGKFQSVINYLSSGITEDLFVVHGEDTLKAISSVYTRTFGIGDATSVMVVFDKNFSRTNQQVKFFLDDTMLGTGLSEFDFEINDIKKTPTINF